MLDGPDMSNGVHSSGVLSGVKNEGAMVVFRMYVWMTVDKKLQETPQPVFHLILEVLPTLAQPAPPTLILFLARLCL